MAAHDALTVDTSNTDQLWAWDGDEGAYWAQHAEHFERSALPFHRRLLAAAGIARDERVLDIGCGTGQTTREAARIASSGDALGIDLSSRMIEHARRRAARDGIANAHFEQADAQIHGFEPGGFDVAISNTGATFFGDLVAGFTNIGRALRSGGRLVLLTWQPLAENEWTRELTGALSAGRTQSGPPPDDHGPFSLSDPARVRHILTAAGFSGIEIDGAHESMWFGRNADDAFEFVFGLLGWMVEGLDDDARARALDALHATTAAHETTDGVIYDSAVWIVRATHEPS